MNRRIKLHGRSFTISHAVSRPVLKVKDAKTKLEVGQSGSRGSRHMFHRIPTPPRMAEFPVTQDGTCGVLDPRHKASSIGFLPVSVFTKYFFRITKKRLHMVVCFIRFGFRFIPFRFCLLQVLIKDVYFAITALISKSDEGWRDLKDYFCLDDQEGSIKGVYFWCYRDVLPF